MRDRFTTTRAKELRSIPTDAERHLWYFLRRDYLGCRFRRQHPIGPYIADFACIDLLIVVEIDGGQHAMQSAYDESRDHFIRSRGFIVLRFWGNEVLRDTQAVLEVIRRTIENRKMPPP